MAQAPLMHHCAFLFGAAMMAAALTGCAEDPAQGRLCARAVAILAEPGAIIEIVATDRSLNPAYDVVVRYRAGRTNEAISETAVWCRFGGERHDLQAVATESGALTPVQMLWLRRVLGLRAEFKPSTGATPGAAIDAGLTVSLLYFLQQSLNATVLAAVYSLVAIAFTLVYGIVRKINFAFGEIYAIGAVVSVLATVTANTLGAGGPLLSAALAFVTASASAALYGWVSDRVLFRPLRDERSHAPLIAAIGLSILLQEFLHLTQGGRDFWIAPDYGESLVLAEAAGFTFVAAPAQAGIIVLTLAIYFGVFHVRMHTAFGRAQRACGDDPGLAALLGVDLDRVIGTTFMIGAATAGIAGFVIVEYYGVANFFMGVAIGFKALAAAIVGGIGSVTGAVLGAAIIAFLEVFWSAYLDISTKDVAVFGLLILVLIFRPEGLMGVPRGRGD